MEFVKSRLDYSDGVKHNERHHSCKQVVPKLLAERERFYEWVLAMFEKEIQGKKCSYKDGVDLIQGLKSKISIPVNTDNNYYGLNECIISMFGESDKLENTELEIHNNYTNIPVSNTYTNKNRNGLDVSINRDTVDKIALGDVFKQGRHKMIEMKIPMARERKK